MAITVKINGGNQDFEPLSEGVHPAVLADIVDLGMITNGYGKNQHKVRFVWITDEKDSDGRQKYAFKRYTLSLHEKATLRKDFKDATKLKEFIERNNPDEDFDIDVLLGQYANLVIQHSEDEKTGKVYANIITLMKPTKKVAVPSDFVRNKDKDKSKVQSNGVRNPVAAAGGGAAVAAAVLAPPVDDPITDEDIPF